MSQAVLQEPELSPAARRVLGALLLSLGLHAAIIGLVRIAPASRGVSAPVVMQVQLAQPAAVPVVEPVKAALNVPVLSANVPSSTSVPVAPSVAVAASVPVPAATESQVKDVAPVDSTIPPNSSNLPQIDVPVAVDPTYYTAKEVDVHPRDLGHIQPVYPPAAVANNEQGWVKLRIKLDETGKVEDVKVVDAAPAGVFDESAMDAFKQGKFAPAQKSGRAVKSLMEIKVWFKLD